MRASFVAQNENRPRPDRDADSAALLHAFLLWRSASSAGSASTAFALDSAKPNSPAKIPVQTFTSVEQAFQAGVHDLMAGDAAVLGPGADLRRRRRPAARAMEARPHVRARRRRAARRRQGLRLFRASGRKLQRGRSRPAGHRRDLQRFRRGRRLLPQRHSQQRDQAGSGARAGDVPVRGDQFRRSRTRSTISRACIWTARRASRATTCARRDGWRSPPTRAIIRPRRCSATCCSSAKGVPRQRARGLMWLTLAKTGGAGPEGRMDPRALRQGLGGGERRRP